MLKKLLLFMVIAVMCTVISCNNTTGTATKNPLFEKKPLPKGDDEIWKQLKDLKSLGERVKDNFDKLSREKSGGTLDSTLFLRIDDIENQMTRLNERLDEILVRIEYLEKEQENIKDKLKQSIAKAKSYPENTGETYSK